jgi:Ca-dependent carbohydrate-binding module xylan-binding
LSTGSSTTSYPPVSNGTGPDSIVLQVSENAWANGGSNADAHGDAEFTVAVNGVQQGGTYTALAPHGTADQTFTLNGTFGANPTLAVAFINDAYGGSPQADRNLYVDSISYDGANQNQSREIRSDGTVTFDLTGAGNDGSGSSGSGPAGPVTSLHYAANANFATGSYNAAGDPGSDGFNLADVGSAAAADSLPSGVKGLVWLGDPAA